MSQVEEIERVLRQVKALIEDECELDEEGIDELASAIVHSFLCSGMTHTDYKIAYRALLDRQALEHQREVTEDDVKEGDDVLLHDDLP
jgi:hypothetical protein